MRCSYAMDGCVGKTKVLRTVDYGYYIERVRVCVKCGEKLRTTERLKVDVQVRQVPEKSAAARKPATLAAGTMAREKLKGIPAGRWSPGDRGCY